MEQATLNPVTEAVKRYCAASVANDLDGIMATLAPDAELVSPLSAKLVFRGHEDLRILVGAVYATLRELRWEEPIGAGSRVVAVAVSRSGGMRLDDAMLFELNPQGEIARLRPHLRPWLATTLFAPRLALKLARHPGLMWRAARSGRGRP